MMERARILWPILEDVDFIFQVGAGESRYEYGVLNNQISIVRVTQYVPEDASDEKRLDQFAWDLGFVLDKDHSTIRAELEMN